MSGPMSINAKFESSKRAFESSKECFKVRTLKKTKNVWKFKRQFEKSKYSLKIQKLDISKVNI